MRITVYKARRRLVLRQGRRVLLRCRCHLGGDPVRPKMREGDGRTPEGAYRICSRNPKSKYHLALGISYPNARDARCALGEGRIGRAQYDAIASAARRGVLPPWDTPLGGWIMIHGQPQDGRDGSGDWTAGCIAVTDSDMEVLFRACGIGTKVIIRA